ncbi:MAG: aminomethyl-transferring glycine dehydrogenase subunit GcvPA [Firmicutes bacterium]|nr:aminomethyl-transferring glycine dehydrogenase subunit GcvPA [Bacillota bacterium]
MADPSIPGGAGPGSAHPYLPHTTEDRMVMLSRLGLDSSSELFRELPSSLRMSRPLALPAALSELELLKTLKALADGNLNLDEHPCFLGAGVYDHYVPSVVDHVLGRSEFYTSYTPYQPEMSQGMLQAIFEYQTLICELTGMEVANASLYDGGSSLAEAALMGCRASGREEVLIARTVNPFYREVVATYLRTAGFAIREIPLDESGAVDLDLLAAAAGSGTAALILQSPNFFGILEDLEAAGNILRRRAPAASFVVSADPISLALLRPPGELGVDIVVGEGQVLGNHPSFGGPLLGIMACTEKLLRRMPGRIVGETTDAEGRRGYVLTIQTREQHIRREKATSNICTNQALNALAAAVYLTVLGKDGLREVAFNCCWKGHYARERFRSLRGFAIPYQGPCFREFVVNCPIPPAELNSALIRDGIIGGYPLARHYPEREELRSAWLLCVTERRTRAEIDRLAEAAAAAAALSPVFPSPEGGTVLENDL